MPDYVFDNGINRLATVEEQAEIDVRRLRGLEDTRLARRDQFRRLADQRIAQLVGMAADASKDAVLVRQINMVGAALRAARAEARAGGEAEGATPLLDAMESLYGVIEQIRAAENAASAALWEAGTDERMTAAERAAEIDAVQEPAFP